MRGRVDPEPPTLRGQQHDGQQDRSATARQGAEDDQPGAARRRLDRLAGPGSLQFSPGRLWLESVSRFVSPHEANPGNYHPLRNVLGEQIDFERLRAADAAKRFVCAANVLNNRVRVFDRAAMSVDAVLASACLPTLFAPVEIDGEHYWDGGYLGNPPPFPLIEHCASRDVLLILINPLSIAEVLRTARAVADRINTISFNSSLMREMRAIEFVNRLVERGFDDGGRLKKVLVHCVDAEAELGRLGADSKLNVTGECIDRLFALGRARADVFLEAHFDRIGVESSTLVQERFL